MSLWDKKWDTRSAIDKRGIAKQVGFSKLQLVNYKLFKYISVQLGLLNNIIISKTNKK